MILSYLTTVLTESMSLYTVVLKMALQLKSSIQNATLMDL